MTNQKHNPSPKVKSTPGPWEISKEEEVGDTAIVGANGQVVCEYPYLHPDARLIVAAPDLLQKLKQMVDAVNVESLDPLVVFACIEQAKGAIAKAERGE